MLEIVCADGVSEGLSAPTCSTDLAHCAIVEVRKWNSSPCSASSSEGRLRCPRLEACSLLMPLGSTRRHTNMSMMREAFATSLSQRVQELRCFKLRWFRLEGRENPSHEFMQLQLQLRDF